MTTTIRAAATILLAAALALAWLLTTPALAHPDDKPHPLAVTVAVDCGTATITLTNGHTAPVLWTITTSDGAYTVEGLGVPPASDWVEVVSFAEDSHDGKAFVKWDAIGPEADWRHAASGAVDVDTDCQEPEPEPSETELPTETPTETEEPTEQPTATEQPTEGPSEDPTGPGSEPSTPPSEPDSPSSPSPDEPDGSDPDPPVIGNDTPTGDLDCADFPLTIDGQTVTAQDVLNVFPDDPFRLDGDSDGIACETDQTENTTDPEPGSAPPLDEIVTPNRVDAGAGGTALASTNRAVAFGAGLLGLLGSGGGLLWWRRRR